MPALRESAASSSPAPLPEGKGRRRVGSKPLPQGEGAPSADGRVRAETDLKSQISNSGANPEPRTPSPAPAVGAVSDRRPAVGTPPLQRALNLLPYQRRWVEDDSTLKIAVKARQIGYSFAATLRAVFKCLERKTTWIFLSKGERQSRLLMEKVQDHIRSCGLVVRTEETTFFEGTSLKQLEVRFPNGSVIYGLPANPDTARGYSGHVTLDEFAFHADAAKIYAALFPTITRGYGLEVISTPNGTQGKFYELAKAAGLSEERKLELGSGKSGSPDSLLPTSYSRSSLIWSPHYCDIYDAVRDGLQIDINLLRSGCEDASAWQQEFCCQFVSTAENFFSPELITSSLSAEATTECDLRRQPAPLTELGLASAPRAGEIGVGGQVLGVGEEPETFAPETRHPAPDTCFYLGIDIGRRHDRTVFWVDEVVRLEPQKLETGNWKLETGNSERQMRPRSSEAPFSSFQFPVSNCQFPISTFSPAISNLKSEILDFSVARLVRTLDNVPFAEQLQAARELLSLRADAGAIHESPFLIRRACIDATGIGAPLAEALEREFGPRVEPVVFTAAVKEDLAFRTKRRMEARLTLLPDTREIRRAFSAVKKFVTPSGNLRFDAARTEAGHADEFWAKALADLAADPQARQIAARAEDAFLVDAMPIVSPVAFREVDSNWSELLM